MNTKTHLTLLSICIAVALFSILQSCEKPNLHDSVNQESTITYKDGGVYYECDSTFIDTTRENPPACPSGFTEVYKLNGEVTDSFDITHPDYYPLVKAFYNEETENLDIVYMAFTTLNSFNTFCENNNLPFDTLRLLAEDLAYYADTSGTIDAYESNGDISENYISYQCEKFAEYYGSRLGKTQIIGPPLTFIRKGCQCTQQTMFVLAGLPVMWPGWNNDVSSFYPLHIYGYNWMFDRSFFRRPLPAIWSWGWNCINLCSPPEWNRIFNDRASSWLVG